MPKIDKPQRIEHSLWVDKFPRLHVHQQDHCAHWKVYDHGHAFSDLTLYGTTPAETCLSMDTQEYTQGAKSGKRTMFTLDAAATRALYDMLKQRYEGGAK